MPKHKTRNIFMKHFIKSIYEKYGLEASSRPFLIFKEFPVKRNLRRSVLIWTNFDSFANTYLILVACFYNLIFQ